MANVVARLVKALRRELEDLEPVTVVADKRWRDPDPGRSVVVIRSQSDWSGTSLAGATLPVVEALIYTAPTPGQDDAGRTALEVVERVRRFLHTPTGPPIALPPDAWVLRSKCVGRTTGPAAAEATWSLTTLVFETMVTA